MPIQTLGAYCESAEVVVCARQELFRRGIVTVLATNLPLNPTFFLVCPSPVLRLTSDASDLAANTIPAAQRQDAA